MTDPATVVQTKVRVPRAASMPVERLDARLETAWAYRLALVIAPAGSGKTTLLARFAERAGSPVGWYRAEAWDGDEQGFVRHLEAALAPQLDGLKTGWSSVADAANALDAWHGPRVLLIVDDLHTLEGSAGEAALERLIDYAPPTLTVIAATRVPPRFNLPRLRVSGALLEIGSDELRFRSWEVERLFRDFYENPLPPEELARLARRTEGWAAGLQLFHLATHGRAPDERRRVLAALGPSSRLMRDYLTRNVLEQLPPPLRTFLVETSVLGRLSADLCDQLLERSGSSEMLAELERRSLFTQALPETGVYRYHEVLRSHLQGVLLEELGQGQARERFRRAGRLLADAGALPEALDALCRAEDWETARNLLGKEGEAVAHRSSAWIDALPGSMLQHDPWLLLAAARRLRAEGRFADALERYQRAEVAFGSTERAAACRNERNALATWLSRPMSPRSDASSLLRRALFQAPLSVAREARALPSPEGTLIAGLAALAGGHVASARRELLHAAERPDAGPATQAIASLGAGVAGLFMGQPHAALEIEGAAATAEELGLEWLARLGRSTLALSGSVDAMRETQAIAVAAAGAGDVWGDAIAKLSLAWGALTGPGESAGMDELASQLRLLDAAVLESWARAIAALARVRAGEPDAREAAVTAEASARSSGVDAARMIAYLALAEASPADASADDYAELADGIARETGLLKPSPRTAGATAAASPAAGKVEGVRGNGAHNGHGRVPPVSIRVLGGFELRLAGQDVDLVSVRPRARALLRLLGLNAGSPVHHESIEAVLWPDATADASSRNLHVAVAALRRALEPRATRGSYQLLLREGYAYRLALPEGSTFDLHSFARALSVARAARDRSDWDTAVRAYQEALELYRGDVLPEDGPAEWVAQRREECQLATVEASQALAEVLLERGEVSEAARVCAVGLRVERYHDPLWRLLIRARDAAGDQGAATRARLSYDRILAELGINGASANQA